jgi:endo-1,4-beta-xylanase
MFKTISAGLLLGMSLAACTSANLPQKEEAVNAVDSTKGLKDYYGSFFPIGVAVSPRALKTDEANLVVQHFSSLTPENAMKMGPIHPGEREYNWGDADSIVAFAERNNMRLRGHTLVWHNQTPGWLFKDASGNQVSKEVLLQRMKDHITTVVGRYKGKIYAWDVVNEAISDKKDEYLRPSKWLEIIGEEYIAKAFQFAQSLVKNTSRKHFNLRMKPTQKHNFFTMITTRSAQ